MKKKFLSAVLVAIMLILTACGGGGNEDAKTSAKRGLDDITYTQMSLAGVDRVGREIVPMDKQKNDQDRYVGLFYLCWLGQEPTLQDGIYNITELLQTQQGRENLWNYIDPDPSISPLNKFHFVNEPLYGYYNSGDEWVVTRHLELFSLAGVDYLYIDVSNGNIYEYNTGLNGGKERGGTTTLLDTALKLYESGWNVPKLMFFTNSFSGNVVNNLYEAFYKDGKYEDLWFKPYGKPMISAITENNNGASDMKPGVPDYVPVSKAMQQYFDIKESQWPTPSCTQVDNGFQWMSWTHPQNLNGNTISVTPAQHHPTSAKYSDQHKQSSRGYDYTDIKNPVHEDWESGINFQRQWETVFMNGYEENINFVNVTGWNEWTPIKYAQTNANGDYITGANGKVVYFVDGFSAEYSRDIEMDRNYYKDNFYMQLVYNIRKYKYGDARSYTWQTGNNTANGMTYVDMKGDAIERDYYGFVTSMRYTDNSNRNDISTINVIHDKNNIYFEIETVNALTLRAADDLGYMNILIKTKEQGSNFEGYQYVINRRESDGNASIERSKGGYNWETIGEAKVTVSENIIKLTVPRTKIGLSNDLYFEFKVTDNLTAPDDIMDYYISGDCAPLGRLNYAYGY